MLSSTLAQSAALASAADGKGGTTAELQLPPLGSTVVFWSANELPTVELPPGSVAVGRPAVGRVPDSSRGDVDPMRAEDRPHAPDHPRQVLIAEHGHVRLELDRQTAALDLDEVRLLLRADAGAGDGDALAAGDHGDADQLVEVLRLGD